MPLQGTSGNHLRGLREEGQSIWLDYIRRALITGCGLKRLIDEDGLAGITSNPSIFDKAIDGSTDYNEALSRLRDSHLHTEPQALYDQLVIEDVRMAADILRSSYEESGGTDGFVSIEPPPS